MKIKVNGQNKELTGIHNLNDLVEQLRHDNRRIIAELNGDIVRTPQWNQTPIKEGDAIELVSLVGGG